MTGVKIRLLKLQKSYLQAKYFAKYFNIFSKEKLKTALVLGLFVLCVGGFYGLGHAANAQDSNDDPNINNTAFSNEGTAQYTFNSNFLNGMASDFMCKTGFCGKADDSGGVTAYNPRNGGAMGQMLVTTGKMYTSTPASTHTYIAYLMDKAEIGPTQLYAQETEEGFDILSPILPLWEWVRNVVYLFYVIIFLAIGLMIVLRQRIGGQIPITIINSIPSVIFSLVLVTFSFAISGLLMDFMNLGAGLIHAGLFTYGDAPGAGIDGITEGNFMFQSPEMSVFKIFGTAEVTKFEAGFEIPDISVGESGAGWLLNVLTDVIEGLSDWNVLVSTVLVIAAVSAMFKIFFSMLTNYLTFMIYPVLAPIQFLLGSLPGRQNLIWDWFRKMTGAVGAFLGVYLAFCLMVILSIGTKVTDFSWSPPLTAFTTDSDTIRHLLSYAIFIATPQVPGMVQQMLQTAPPQIGSVIGGETRGALSRVGSLIGFG